MKLLSIWSATFISGVAIAPAFGQPNAAPVPPNAEPAPKPGSFSLTFSPVHLATPVLEITGEKRLGRALSLAAILGGGPLEYEVGAQANYYALGSFDHGLQLGAEALYLDAQREGEQDIVYDALTFGAYVGYKLVIPAGLTFNAQVGVKVVAIEESTSGEGYSDSPYRPLLNLNIGWTF